MTVKEFNALRPGSLVQWREGAKSPRAGEVTEIGVVVVEGGRRFAKWPDGQETDNSDDWALQNVEPHTPIPSALPQIQIHGAVVWSNSGLAPHQPDTCAYWSPAADRRVEALLREKRDIACTDATAYAAVLAMALELSMRGIAVSTVNQITRDYTEA
jgi:hypothetical protein